MSPCINYCKVSVFFNFLLVCLFWEFFGFLFCFVFKFPWQSPHSLLSPPPPCFILWGWVFNKLLFRRTSAFRHPFTDVVIAWFHHLNIPGNHRNCRQKNPAAAKGGVCPPVPAQATGHASHCPRMEPKQISMVTPSSLGQAGNKEEEERRWGWREDRWSSQARLVHGKDCVRLAHSALSLPNCFHSPGAWRGYQPCRCHMHPASIASVDLCSLFPTFRIYTRDWYWCWDTDFDLPLWCSVWNLCHCSEGVTGSCLAVISVCPWKTAASLSPVWVTDMLDYVFNITGALSMTFSTFFDSFLPISNTFHTW